MAKVKKDAAKVEPGKGKNVLIKSPGQKANFWKPKVIGETVIGKLVKIVNTVKYGDSMRLMTPAGTVCISVNVYLSDIPWEEYIGKTLLFKYAGTVGERNCRTYEVSEVQEPN